MNNSVKHTQFIDSSLLLRDGNFAALRQRANEEGYLFFKQLLPVQEVLRLREDLLAVVEKYGWREAGQDAQGGLINLNALNQVPDEQMRNDIGVSHAAYDDVQKLESFHALPHHPHLIALYQGLFGQEVFVHPRHIARMITSHRVMSPTPLHQDFPLIQGSTDTWTCWFPLGDCPRSLGGLTVLRASHHEGYIPIQAAPGAGGIAVQLCEGEEVWVEGDYVAGDVLTFPCFTVHKALPCQHKDQIRLSIDARYQAATEPIEARSLQPHCDLTWEEIYANWEQDNLKYYWRQSTPKLSPWDDTLMQPARRIC
ncbi:phytanoyl-CoA dioxygenase family protein [Candidatus Leptofilum sp.]|uniref:phytanoyl-CoA dioxygenase family protein n=1 Tax=Candidatus Leptofilum sp. TaxID=3241576 RepID=UPI003B58FF2E